MHRYRTQALRTASQRDVPTVESIGGILPTHHTAKKPKPTQAGGLSNSDGRDAQPTASPSGGDAHILHGLDGAGHNGRDLEKSVHHSLGDSIPGTTSPAAPPPHKSEDASSGNPAIESVDEGKTRKPPITTRIKAGCTRFVQHTKDVLFRNWLNVLLVLAPIGWASHFAHFPPGAIFAINAIAIIPLAGLLTHATEEVASALSDGWGAFFNVTFGNSVELIIFIIALVKGEIRIVQASILGSVLANLLLILGMAFFLGGLKYHEQVYNSTITQMSCVLLCIAVLSLLLPTAFHASFKQANIEDADNSVLKVSRGTSVVLLLVYVLYLLFQFMTHKQMYASTPQHILDEEASPGVLHGLMDSSSDSSSSSSDSSDSDSDSTDSGSFVTKAKKVKRIFKKRRKSSGGSSGSSLSGAKEASTLSSPSTQERVETSEYPFASHANSRRESNVAAHAAHDGDLEDNGVSRNFDWATHRQVSNDGTNSTEMKKSRKRSKKDDKKEKKRKHRRHHDREDTAIEAQPAQPKVEFDDEVTIVQSPGPIDEESDAQPASSKMPFNMRGLSSLTRPGLSKMLSNTVFGQPPPASMPQPRPTLQQSQSSGSLRRTSSLPGRLNQQMYPTDRAPPIRTGPLPPFHSQRLRKATSDMSNVLGQEEDEDADGDGHLSRTAAIVLLFISTVLVALSAELMVEAIPEMLASSDAVSEAFIGLIVLPIVGNAAEHVTAVTVAVKNKVDLAIGVAVGSSIQIALLVTPLVVLIGWILDKDMSLYFNLFETVSLFVAVFVVNFLIQDGRTNYLEGALLMAAYVIIGLIAFYYPDTASQSTVGGGSDGT